MLASETAEVLEVSVPVILLGSASLGDNWRADVSVSSSFGSVNTPVSRGCRRNVRGNLRAVRRDN